MSTVTFETACDELGDWKNAADRNNVLSVDRRITFAVEYKASTSIQDLYDLSCAGVTERAGGETALHKSSYGGLGVFLLDGHFLLSLEDEA